MAAIYVATAVSTGTGRDGHVETSDGKVSLDLAFPRELGGSGAGPNPEQLVAMGYAARFSGALSAVARRRGIGLSDVEVTCSVTLHQSTDGYVLSFDIVARLPGLAAQKADSLVAEAHAFCPYSKAFTHGRPLMRAPKPDSAPAAPPGTFGAITLSSSCLSGRLRRLEDRPFPRRRQISALTQRGAPSTGVANSGSLRTVRC